MFLLAASTNMTDYLINIFGWDTMQLLWDPLTFLFECIEAVFSINLDPLWEILFT